MGVTGVLLAAFGGPECLDAVEPFMCRLMGRAPDPIAVDAAKARYESIGGGSPLATTARRLADALAERLADEDAAVECGMRYCEPAIGEAVDALVRGGADRIVWLTLSPFESAVSTGAYRRAVEDAVAEHGSVTLVEAADYHAAGPFADLLARACEDALAGLPPAAKKAVLLTAHSLPVAEASDDPYEDQLRETAELVAQRAGLGGADARGCGVEGLADAFGGVGGVAPWALAYQSAGRRGGEWLGPSLEHAFRALGVAGFEAVAVCPIGFALDHMETLYDLDVEAAAKAAEAGLAFARGRVPNDAPAMIDVYEAAVRQVW